MTNEDPLAGLDPDEIAEVEAVLAAEHQRGARDKSGAPRSYRRATTALLVFVLAFLPVFLGIFWLGEQFVYTPLCGRDSAISVVDVDIDLPIDGSYSGITDGRTTCVFADGDRSAMQEVIPKGVAIALDWALSIAVLVGPFVVTAAVLRLVPKSE